MGPTEVCAGIVGAGVRVGGRALATVDPAALPEARARVATAVDRRQREYVGGRLVARDLLVGMGFTDGVVVRAAGRAPVWPDGVTGSITHAWRRDGAGWVLVAVGPAALRVGIDLEPDEPLPEGVAGHIHAPGDAAPAGAPERLVFSAKEAVYKAIAADAGRVLGFEEVALVAEADRLWATLRAPAGRWPAGETFAGRWAAAGGWVVTAFSFAGRMARASAG